jgi:hypothetical protein
MKNWTVIFFIHEAKGYNPYVINLFTELKSIEKLGNLNVIIIFDTSDTNERGVFLLENNQLKKLNYDLLNMSDYENWIKVLSYSKSNYQADRYMIFTWGHGFSYGIAKNNIHGKSVVELTENNELSDYFLKKIKNIFDANMIARKSNLFRQKLQLLLFYKQLKQLGVLKVLWIGDLNKAILSVFGSKKIDVLIMMNCQMQSIENAFDLRNSTKLLIAPETNMKFNGYPYRDIFEGLNNNDKNWDLLEILKFTKNQYVKKYQNEGIEDLLEMTTFFGIFLEYQQQYFNLLEDFFKLLDKLLKDEKNFLLKIRNSLEAMGSTYQTDLLTTLNLVSKSIKNNQLIEKYIAVKDFYYSHLCLEDTYYVGKVMKKINPTGQSVFFPESNVLHDIERPTIIYITKKSPSDFVSNSTWRSIMIDYLKNMVL